MKTLFFSLFMPVLIASCGGGGSNGDIGNIFTGDSLVGQWVIVYDGSLCEETYDFNADDTFTIESLDEQVTGEYSTSSVAESDDRKRITLTILTDNGLPDCEGDSADDSNTEGYLFYEIDGDTFYWFETDSSTEVLAEMQRK